MDTDRALPHASPETSEEPDILVNKTAHFVGEWIDEHLAEVPAALPDDLAAESLADRCIADAASEGILPEDISEEVGDLKEYIADTLRAEHGPTGAGSGNHGEGLTAPEGETNAEIPL
ncbi:MULTISPECIES: DUF768 domain-containing protein [unclassified Mesorhizobium]|uniref:DUF768 domain-containing protein n=1 Tax=unclassified Mesorhizobium TaxID=325217 RepID=UPI0013EB0C42|nr:MULTISPECIES: DUF768 domain-containing protein [unclassified Mesorhizobium]